MNVQTINVGSAYHLPACYVTYTAGANQTALIRYQLSAQFGAADVLFIAPVVDAGSGFTFAVTRYEFAGTGTLDTANVGSSARIPLTAGTTYTFSPSIAAAHINNMDVTVLAGMCHGTVTIVTEGTGAPLAPLPYSPSLLDPLTGAETKLR